MNHLAKSGHGVVFNKFPQHLGLTASLACAQADGNLQTVARKDERRRGLLFDNIALNASPPRSDDFEPGRAHAEPFNMGEVCFVALHEHDGFPLIHSITAFDSILKERNSRHRLRTELVFLLDALTAFNGLELCERVG